MSTAEICQGWGESTGLTYHKIGRRIQKVKDPRKKRLRNRTEGLRHKISRVMVSVAEGLKAGVVMEDLSIKRKNRGKR